MLSRTSSSISSGAASCSNCGGRDMPPISPARPVLVNYAPSSPNGNKPYYSDTAITSSTSNRLTHILIFVAGMVVGVLSSHCFSVVPFSCGVVESLAKQRQVQGAAEIASVVPSQRLRAAAASPSAAAASASTDPRASVQGQQQQQDGDAVASALATARGVRDDAARYFTGLLDASKSDKYWKHHYETYYAKWFDEFRTKDDLSLLEIGAADGKSMNVWDRYFVGERARVTGLAYGRFTENTVRNTSKLEKVRIVYGDQSQKETMAHLADVDGPYDIIIDDGSHVPGHMTFSLYSLWDRAVKPGGIYVIEDLETNYWPDGTVFNEYTLDGTGILADARHSVVAKVSELQHVLMKYQIGASDELSGILPGDGDICSIEWGRNLVALRKCPEGTVPPPASPTKIFDREQMDAFVRRAKSSNPF